MKADKLIIGNIITLNSRNTVAEALAVSDGKIQYVGSLELAGKLCDENTEIADYSGSYIYPGFIDAHCHGSLACTRLPFFADLVPGKSYADYIEILKNFMASHPGNAAIYGAGWKCIGEDPDARMLDAICPDKPMALHSIDGHSVWLNTKAMEIWNINNQYALEQGTSIVRVRDDGSPTGYISEAPALAIADKMSKFSAEELKHGFLVWQQFAFEHGITAYYEAGCPQSLLDLVASLIQEGKWKLRLYGGYMFSEKVEDYVAEVRHGKELADIYNCEYFKIIGIKTFTDGVTEAHTAWTIDNYLDRPDYNGEKRFCDFDRVVELYKEAARLGLNVHSHTIGDGAVKFVLDCIEKAQTETGIMNMRNALAHLQLLRPEDVKRLCDLNCVAVVAPLWMSKQDYAYHQSLVNIGEQRAFHSYPLKSFLDNHGTIAFHTDYPVSPSMSPTRSIYMACKRKEPHTDDFYQLDSAEGISREAALEALTKGPAYSVMEENRLGQLEVGYIANMVVYDKDFLNDELEEIADSKLIATIVDGNEVYRS